MKRGEQGYADVGFGDTTKDPTSYSHPDNDKIVYYDLPGVGTLEIKKENFINDMKMSDYDFIFIFFDKVITEDNLWLVGELDKMGKPYSTAAEEKDMPIDLLEIKTHFIPHPEENIFFWSRRLQRLFILSSIFHTQNNAYTQPLHMILTDTADKFSNSSTDFLAILSIFGVCVSKDTHQPFLSDVVEQNKTTESTPFKSFAIGSYDNIDKNQVHSSVTAGKSNSGFHGTSVQIVEPLPETLLLSVTNSSSKNSILETTDPLTTLLNSSSTIEMSTSSSEILTLSSEILTSSEFFTSNVIPTSSSVISTSNTQKFLQNVSNKVKIQIPFLQAVTVHQLKMIY
ncbi:Hypothetical predicted protein [Mytilus galloprovincialis]|uniref:IRG-type G domain-containing protein n=1 Tax=Mytilus galloprovincialis TaxID=29158 RepID=A0A8B6FBW7_MYTGA|nr:Hypothetical predicted protein [Mytilus galloprovincialis]